MKIAFVYGGQPRFRSCFTKNFENIKGYEEGHLYFFLWKEYNSSSLFDADKIAINEDNAKQLIEKNIPKNIKLVNFEHINTPTYESLVPKEIENIPRSSSAVPGGNEYLDRLYKQHYGLYNAFNMLKEEYDCIVRFRVDCYPEYYIELDKLNLEEGIYIPDSMRYSEYQEVCAPVNDQFAIGNMKNMKTYFNLFENMTEYFKQNHRTLHLETALSYHLLKNDVKILSAGTQYRIVRN